jgi:hypothetical protein
MGFAENLESDLKNLESAAERDPEAQLRQADAREAARAQALAIQPHAQQLKSSKFTAELLNQASLLGRSQRLAVRILWMGQTLRLQARDHTLELRPTPAGVEGRFLRGAAELERFPVNFSSSPEELARRWLSVVSGTP